MKLSPLVPAILSAILFGCASVGDTSDAKAASAGAASSADDAASDQAKKITKLERKLALSRERLAKTHMEHNASERLQAVKLRHAKIEVEMAEANLAKFRESDVPNRLEREQLALQSARDRAEEAAEELAQIEIMYDEQDIDDVTAEFVVSRGRRRAERAAAQIKLQEREYAALEKRELPEEEKKLKLALDRALEALAKLEGEGAIAALEASIKIKEAEGELADMEVELSELRSGKDQ